VDRAAFGPIAVVTFDDGVRDVDRPVTGWLNGLGHGTVRGVVAIPVLSAAGAGVVAVSGMFYPPAIVGGAIVGAAAGVLYLPASIVGGALTAASEEEVAAAEPAIRAALAEPGLDDVLGASFRTAALARGRGEFVEPWQAQTLVELRIVRVFADTHGRLVSYDPRIPFRAETHARLVRRADGAVLWEWRRTTPEPVEATPALRLAEWGANNANALRHELRRIVGELGREHAEDVFGSPPATSR
jgi:hypothetical protein